MVVTVGHGPSLHVQLNNRYLNYPCARTGIPFMNNDYFRIWAGEQPGYYKLAAQKKAERIRNNTLTLRDKVQPLANYRGVYLVGSSNLGCYKIGFGEDLRQRIGTYDPCAVKIDIIMWFETAEGRELVEHLRCLFRTKVCAVKDAPGDWYALNREDLEILRTKFQFEQFAIHSSNQPIS
jgi:hypothetical protein